jgi:flagellin-like protein
MSTLRSFYRNTKALSPVVATILLVAIAVIASVLTYLWATGFIGAIQTRPSQATETIHIQAASFTAGGTPAGAFTIYIQNAGSQGVTYVQVFLLNTAGTVLGTTTTFTGSSACVTAAAPNNVCAAGSISTIVGNIAGGTSNAQEILQVVTAKGTSAEITLTAG